MIVDENGGVSMPGAKHDGDKPRYLLALESFPRALAAVNAVGEYGVRKYSRGGFLAVENGVERYSEAMVRHVIADALAAGSTDGEGLRHDAAAAWNALARLELRLRDGTP